MKRLAAFLFLLTAPALAQVSLPFPGPGARSAATPTVIFSSGASANTGQSGGFSIRSICVAPSTPGGTQIRVTFKAGSGGTLQLDHASIGISTGTQANTTATPVELKFSGVSGFTLAANGTLTSDWANLTTSSGTNVAFVVPQDENNSAGHFGVSITIGGSNGRYYYSAAATYAAATPGAATGNDGVTDNVLTIEVR